MPHRHARARRMLDISRLVRTRSPIICKRLSFRRYFLCFVGNEVIPRRRRDDAHLIAFEQCGARVVHDAVARGNPLCHFDGVVEEFAHGDRFEVHAVVLRHHGHLRAVLLEHQRGGRNREYLSIDRRRELDLGVGAGPEGSGPRCRS